jgi:hypothetical protein
VKAPEQRVNSLDGVEQGEIDGVSGGSFEPEQRRQCWLTHFRRQQKNLMCKFLIV